MGLLVGREREDASTEVAKGTLTRGGPPVPRQVTEELLRDFLDEMSALEADLARRWVGAGGRSVFARSE
ncbi:hypothetical protein ABZ858_33645 [Streptomyces sp. NPDC047017]|uniref:hypothetical protein n=1 Tax=Streptomyces sp. NPDC047017 TaxID=3155024 RepID=UPI0033C0F950